MATIEYTLKYQAGSYVRGLPEVYVMKKGGGYFRVPCAGCEYEERAREAEGHYVKVVASRYTQYPPTKKYAEWRTLGDNDAVLGWRTRASSRQAGMWVVYLLEDKRGQLIIVPRYRTPSEENKKVASG
jgi:hypothetical protein